MHHSETFYNVVRCGEVLCVEFDCLARRWVEENLNLRVESAGEVCFSSLPYSSKDEAIKFLVANGVPEERIAVEGSPLAIKAERGREPTVKVCPVCGSTRIVEIGVVGLTPPLYVCENCGYRGALVLEVVL